MFCFCFCFEHGLHLLGFPPSPLEWEEASDAQVCKVCAVAERVPWSLSLGNHGLNEMEGVPCRTSGVLYFEPMGPSEGLPSPLMSPKILCCQRPEPLPGDIPAKRIWAQGDPRSDGPGAHRAALAASGPGLRVTVTSCPCSWCTGRKPQGFLITGSQAPILVVSLGPVFLGKLGLRNSHSKAVETCVRRARPARDSPGADSCGVGSPRGLGACLPNNPACSLWGGL